MENFTERKGWKKGYAAGSALIEQQLEEVQS